MTHPTRARSVAKAVTWRLLASLDTFTLGFLVTGKPLAAASIAGGEVLTKMLLYYLHERGWAAVDWGHRPARHVFTRRYPVSGPGPGPLDCRCG